VHLGVAEMRVKDRLRETVSMLLPVLVVLVLVVIWPQVAFLQPSLISPEFP
jgi:TRAP-type C4-dicarboxylate transport system permease large subunit